MERVFGAAAVSSLFLLFLAGPADAQSPPLPGPPPPVSQPFPGFVSPYEVMRMVRASGFAPLAPPLRQGTIYVLRATDFRGILMRVVVDGRTGAFREVSRIVPEPGRYGQLNGGPPYGPPGYDAAMAGPPEVEPSSVRPTTAHPMPAAAVPSLALPPPLPRPRPAALASRSPIAAKPTGNPQPSPSPEIKTRTEPTPSAGATPAADTAMITKPVGPSDGKPQANSEVITAPPPPAAVPKKSTIPAEPLND